MSHKVMGLVIISSIITISSLFAAEGELLHKVDLKFERATFMHDMAITEK